MPNSPIHLLPTHPPRHPPHNHPHPIQTLLQITPLHRLPLPTATQPNPPLLYIPIRTIKPPLNPRDEVKVTVDAGGSGELLDFDVGAGVPLAVAGGPGFVPFVAGEAAG